VGRLCPARADTAPWCQSLRHRKEAVEALHGQTSGAFAVLEYRSEASTRKRVSGQNSASCGGSSEIRMANPMEGGGCDRISLWRGLDVTENHAPRTGNPENVGSMRASDRQRISLTGSCLCGAVRYEASGTPKAFDLCHCSRCRKSSGSAFVAELVFDASEFRWARGESLVRTYEAPVRERPPGYRRTFCAVCGGPVPTVVGNMIRIVGGTRGSRTDAGAGSAP
jgi:hypothetical protein